MNDRPPRPTTTSRDIQSRAQEFQSYYDSARTHNIESFLAESVPAESVSEALVLQLVQREFELVRQQGQSPKLDEYVQRFPQLDADSIRELLALPAPPPRSMAGPLLPTRYQPVAEIGRGGMGSVWRVWDRPLQRSLAVKVLNQRMRHRPAACARLEREALLLGTLQHPGIPPVHERGELLTGSPFFAMKLVEGQTLAELLSSIESPEAERQYLLGIFEQVGQTIAFAHSQGVVHRDLKPQNIMVGEFGEVQIMDWGMARKLSEPDRVGEGTDPPRARGLDDDIAGPMHETVSGQGDGSVADPLRTLTRQGDVFGTPAYMAPEQARGDIEYTARPADVFGLGAILYEVLTGECLYAEIPSERLLEAAAHCELEASLRTLTESNVDATLKELCRDCLAADPAKRPPDGAAVARRTSEYLKSVEQRYQAAEVDRQRAVIQVAEERKRRRLAVMLAGTIVVAVVAGLIAWGWYHSDRQRRARLHRQEQTRTAVVAVATSSMAGLPLAVDRLRPFESEAVNELKQAYSDSKDADRSLRLAIALSEFGQVESKFLVSQVRRVAESDMGPILGALEVDAREAAKRCCEEARFAQTPSERMRYLLVAANLGAVDKLESSLKYASLFQNRVALINLCTHWHGDIDLLLTIATSDKPPLIRYTALASVAQIPSNQLSPQTVRVWGPRLTKILACRHASVRAAAEIVLRRWQVPIERYDAESFATDGGRNWHVNSLGMVMVRIDEPSLEGNSPPGGTGGCSWYIGDREVTVGQYRIFVRDDHRVAERLWEMESGPGRGGTYRDELLKRKEFSQPTEESDRLPIHSIGYYDALRFCNWLSLQEGFEPYYIEPSSDDIRSTYARRYRDEEWGRNPRSDGYRLPELSEFAYVAYGNNNRGDLTTFFAAEEEWHLMYGWCLKNTSRLQPVATRLPNYFGLFDISGNVSEFSDFELIDETKYLRWIVLGESFESPDLMSQGVNRRQPLPSIVVAKGDGFRVVRCDSTNVDKRSYNHLLSEYQVLASRMEAVDSDAERKQLIPRFSQIGFSFADAGDRNRAVESFHRAIRLATELIEREVRADEYRLCRGGDRVNAAIELRILYRLDEADALLEAARTDLEPLATKNWGLREMAERYLRNCRRVRAKVGLKRAEYLACSVHADERDGARAVELAREAIDVLGEDNRYSLAVIAAALAERGRFDQAIQWQQRALELARGSADESEYRQRYDDYRNHQPWHDPRVEQPR